MRVYLDCLAAAAACTVAWTVCPARLRHWLRGLYRLGWYRLTGRMPRSKGSLPEPDKALTPDEAWDWRRIRAQWTSDGTEPGRTEKQP
jgi:hypothetical protein